MSTQLTVSSPASDPQERRKGIGGSDAGIIAGVSPYTTQLDLYLEKKGLWVNEVAGDAAYFGTLLEPVLADEYARRTGFEVATQQEVLGAETIIHPEREWQRGHIDRFVVDHGRVIRGLEIKCTDARLESRWGNEGTDEVPETHICQVMHYMALLPDLEAFDVALLLGGNRFRIYTVPRDDVLIESLTGMEAEFWRRVVESDPPPAEKGERGAQSLARLYPRGAQGQELEATPALLERAESLHRVRQGLDLLEEKKITIQNDIKAVMAEATRLNLGAGSYLSWANNKNSQKTDWKAVAEQLLADFGGEGEAVFRAAVATHTTTTPGPRVFRVQGLDKLFTD